MPVKLSGACNPNDSPIRLTDLVLGDLPDQSNLRTRGTRDRDGAAPRETASGDRL